MIAGALQPELALWKAVLHQAMYDILSNNCRKQQFERRRALSWLYDNTSDFKATCVLADEEPFCVRFKVLETLYVRTLIKRKKDKPKRPRNMFEEGVLVHKTKGQIFKTLSRAEWEKRVLSISFSQCLSVLNKTWCR